MTKTKKQLDLTDGPIISGLVKLALPIMGTSFIQMAYNLTDMFWIGFLGSKAVAAVGIAGFFVWLSMAFVILSKAGTEIKVAQATGAKDDLRAEKVARTGLVANFAIALVYSVIIWLFSKPLIAFFNTNDVVVEDMALIFLKIIIFGMVFNFSNQVFTGIFNGRGDSKTPFIFNTIGLVLNIFLDPMLINGYWIFPEWGVKGAAIATITAQIVVFMCFFVAIKFRHHLFKHFRIFKEIDLAMIKEIIHMGLPPALQNALFTFISMIIARLIAIYGSTPIAVQKVGSQIESISWMTASGFAVALGAFIGQNYGAKKYDRVLEGYKKAIRVAFAIGIFNTVLLFFGAKWLFMIFIREPEAIQQGIDYLRILGLSQLFMCLEITASGVFNGMGNTKPPAIVSTVFNALRIPMAIYFSQMTYLGLNGIWWSIAISSFLKGIVIYVWVTIMLKKDHRFSAKTSSIE